jgi:hypothetical protein
MVNCSALAVGAIYDRAFLPEREIGLKEKRAVIDRAYSQSRTIEH